MYNQLCDIKRIEETYHQVRIKTRHRQKIIHFELFYLINIMQIYFVLESQKYQHSQYFVFLIKEPKYRIIMSENISDKIINHLISNEILLPKIEPRLIETNVATRKNKGVQKGIEYFKKYINIVKKKHDNIYILKCDISKYFYNIDQEILLQKLAKIIKDDKILSMIKNILESANKKETNNQIEKLILNEKKKLYHQKVANLKQKIQELEKIPTYKKGKGIPIGNMTSQIFAIFYLNDLDHFLKEKLKIKYYIRYMDDFVLIHWDKEYLKYCLKEIAKEVKKVKLELNKKTQIYDLQHGINFLGYRFLLKKKKLIVLMNGQTKKRIIKRLNRLSKFKNKQYERVKASYKGYLLRCHCKAFLYRHPWYKEKIK